MFVQAIHCGVLKLKRYMYMAFFSLVLIIGTYTQGRSESRKDFNNTNQLFKIIHSKDNSFDDFCFVF